MSRALPCGVTIDELADYLGRGRTPYDPRIETCPECLNALSAMSSLPQLSQRLIDDDASGLAPPPDTWMRAILDTIALEVRAGRELPVHHPDPRAHVAITEGAVRALIRTVGGRVPGIVVGRTRLEGDVETPGASVAVEITVSVAWGVPAKPAADRLREGVHAALARHTELAITAVDVEVIDIHGPTEGDALG